MFTPKKIKEKSTFWRELESEYDVFFVPHSIVYLKWNVKTERIRKGGKGTREKSRTKSVRSPCSLSKAILTAGQTVGSAARLIVGRAVAVDGATGCGPTTGHAGQFLDGRRRRWRRLAFQLVYRLVQPFDE